MIRQLIKADGTTIDMPARMSMMRIADLIGAEICDVVNLRHMGEPAMVLVCDDAAWNVEVVDHDGYTELKATTPRRPINEKATALYRRNCAPGTTHSIAGDCMLVPDSDFGRP